MAVAATGVDVGDVGSDVGDVGTAEDAEDVENAGDVEGSTVEVQRQPAEAGRRRGWHDPWADLAVPAGWEPVARICEQASADVDRLAEEIADRILADIPAYLETSATDRDELVASIADNVDVTLVGIAEGRGPSPEELEIRRRLGDRRARQNLPIDRLLRAHAIGHQHLWEALIERAEEVDPTSADRLLRASRTAWTWLHEVSGVIAEGHAAVNGRTAGATGALRQRFLDLLVLGDAAEEAAGLAATLGLDPDGAFQAVAARPGDGVDPAAAIDAACDEHATTAAVGRRGGVVIAVTQPGASPALGEAIADATGASGIGIGQRRDGLAGARDSVGDARAALRLAQRRGTPVRFEEEWFAILVSQSEERLAPLLAGGRDAARRSPALAETVLAFAEVGPSTAATADRLHVHPNTVNYRLNRWQELTGWDVRTADGMARSVAAVLLAE